MTGRCCEQCAAPLVRRANEKANKFRKRRFCDVRCSTAHQRAHRPPPKPAPTKRCPVCGCSFARRRHTADSVWEKRIFCNAKCWGVSRRGARAPKKPVTGWQKADASRNPETPPIRPPVDGPKFATVEEFIAFHGVEKIREGMIHYSASNDTGPIPVKPGLGERSFR